MNEFPFLYLIWKRMHVYIYSKLTIDLELNSYFMINDKTGIEKRN